MLVQGNRKIISQNVRPLTATPMWAGFDAGLFQLIELALVVMCLDEVASHRLRRGLQGFQRDAAGQFGMFCLRNADAGDTHLLRDVSAGYAGSATTGTQPALPRR